MSHPHKGQAQQSSRSKMRAMTGHAGGGHAHAGASHFLKTKHGGVIKSEHPSRRKSGGSVPGAGAKPRLDKYARGGRAEGGRAKKGDVNVAIVMPHHQQPGVPVPPAPPPSPMGAPPPSGASPFGAMGALGSQAGQKALGALTGGTGSNPLAGLSRGFKKGGRAKPPKSMPVESFENDGGFSGSGYNGGDYVPTGDKRGGRHKKGGRVAKRDDGGQTPEGPEAPKTQPGSYGADMNRDVPDMITRGMHSIGIPFNWPGSTENEVPKPHISPGQTRAPEKKAAGGKVSIGQRGYHSKSVGTVENGDHLDHWEGYAEKNRNEYTPPYPRTKDSSALARGGRTGGAQTGVGRLEGASEARRDAKGK